MSSFDPGLFAQGAADSAISSALNMWQAKQSRDWQEDMWQKQNEYNLPINQVARLRQAGINPNLAFGSAASAMGAAVPGSPSTPHHDFKPFQSYYEKKSTLASIRQQNANAKSQEIQNDVNEFLLDQTKKVKQMELDWNLQHLMDYKNEELWKLQNERLSLAYHNRLADIEYEIKDSISKGEWIKVQMLNREKEHLEKKYGFEDKYYGNGTNPYEVGKGMGWLRFILGSLTGNGASDVISETGEDFSNLWSLLKWSLKENGLRETIDILSGHGN